MPAFNPSSPSWTPPEGCADDAGRCLQQPVAQHAAEHNAASGSGGIGRYGVCGKVRRAVRPGHAAGGVSRQLGLDVQGRHWTSPSAVPETHKAATYPRSDSGHLPESMLTEVPTVLDSLVKTDPGLRPLIDRLTAANARAPGTTVKVTAHHGIIPTLEPANLFSHERQGTGRSPTDPHALPGAVPAPPRVRPDSERARLRRAVAAGHRQQDRRGRLAPGCWQLQRKSDGDGDDARAARGRWRCETGLSCQIGHVDLKALKTLPPKPYTQGELVKAMKGVARLVTDPRLKQKLKDTTVSAPKPRAPSSVACSVVVIC